MRSRSSGRSNAARAHARRGVGLDQHRALHRKPVARGPLPIARARSRGSRPRRAKLRGKRRRTCACTWMMTACARTGIAPPLAGTHAEQRLADQRCAATALRKRRHQHGRAEFRRNSWVVDNTRVVDIAIRRGTVRMSALCLNDDAWASGKRTLLCSAAAGLLVAVHDSRWLAWSMNADGCNRSGSA
jgi:hypothetical protein